MHRLAAYGVVLGLVATSFVVFGVPSVSACDVPHHGCLRECPELAARICQAGAYAQTMTIAGVTVTGTMTGGDSGATASDPLMMQRGATGAVSFTFTDADGNASTHPRVDFTVSVAQVAGLAWTTPTTQYVTFQSGAAPSVTFRFTVQSTAVGTFDAPFTFEAKEGSTTSPGRAEFPMTVLTADADIDIPFVGAILVVGAIGLAAASRRR